MGPAKTKPAFRINDYIFHGTSGVCQIQDICRPRNLQRIDPSRMYYRLRPLYEKGSVIYTPVDSDKSIVRRILTREEACRLIEQIPTLQTIWIDNEKTREEKYREALHTNSCREWMRVIKTLYIRNRLRMHSGKRVTRTDEKYLRITEDLLFGELAVSLGMSKEQVGECIARHVESMSKSADKCS